MRSLYQVQGAAFIISTDQDLVQDNAPVSRAKFYSDAGLPDPAHDESEVIRRHAELLGNALGRRDVYVEYEADGAQATERCVFQMVNGELQPAELDGVVAIATSNVLHEQFDGRRSKPGFACCL